MKLTSYTAAALLAALVAPVASAASGSTAQQSTPPRAAESAAPAPPTPEESRAERRIEELRGFTVEQRDEAVERARTTLDVVDARLRDWQARMDRDWDRMDAASRERMRRTMDQINRQRVEAATWYGGMRHSSAEAWNVVRTGFANSYRELADSMRRARAELDRGDGGRRRRDEQAPSKPPED